jgi:hypothetical protein
VATKNGPGFWSVLGLIFIALLAFFFEDLGALLGPVIEFLFL